MNDQKVMDLHAEALRKNTLLRDALRNCKADFSAIYEDVMNEMYGDATFKSETAESYIDKVLEESK